MKSTQYEMVCVLFSTTVVVPTLIDIYTQTIKPISMLQQKKSVNHVVGMLDLRKTVQIGYKRLPIVLEDFLFLFNT